MNATLRSRPDDCLSDFVLDQCVAGDLDHAADRRARAHIAACSRCSTRLAAFEAVPVPEVEGVEGERRQRSFGRRVRTALVSASAALALAAGALLGVFRGEHVPSTSISTIPAQGTRAKGTFVLGVVARRASGEVLRLTQGDAVAPGDGLRFELTSAEPGFVAVVGIDSSGAVTPYAPYSGAMHAIPGGTPSVLPDAIEADATLGPERIVALRCPVALSLGEVERAALRALSLAGSEPRRVAALELDCAQATFDIEKRAGSKAVP